MLVFVGLFPGRYISLRHQLGGLVLFVALPLIGALIPPLVVHVQLWSREVDQNRSYISARYEVIF